MLENPIAVTFARLASIPFRLFSRRPFVPPKKAVILKPCCLSQVMMTTPLLAALSDTYPEAQFDWAVSRYARPAIASNPRLSELIDSGQVGLPGGSWSDVRELAERLRQQQYDTCFIPSRSSRLSLVAWMAGIPQRVGLSTAGRGFAHTIAVGPPVGEEHAATVYLSLARALGIETPAHMEFYPPDSARAAMTQLLVDEVDWLGDVPLVLLHPGGSTGPVGADPRKRWPMERFVRLGNALAQEHSARILILGTEEEAPVAEKIRGMMYAQAINLAGRLNLGEVGALAEVADLYVGNDTGPTHVAAAVGCPTLAIYGPSDPARSAPTAGKGRAISLWHLPGFPFDWEEGVSAAEAVAAAEELLAPRKDEPEPWPKGGPGGEEESTPEAEPEAGAKGSEESEPPTA